MELDLPDSFVKEGLKLAEGSYIFGKPLMSLTREEAIAAAAQGWDSERRAREDGMKRTRFLFDLMGVRCG